MNRRDFFRRSAAAAALAGARDALLGADTALGADKARASSRDAADTPRVAVAFEPGFGKSDVPWSRALLDEALRGLPVRYFDAAALASGLQRANTDVLVLANGSEFPIDAFPAMLAYLRKGGHLVIPGGFPFASASYMRGPTCVGGYVDTLYARELGITQAFTVTPRTGDVLAAVAPSGLQTWTKQLTVTAVHELYLCLASEKLHPAEDGSEGIREGVLTPLLQLVDPSGEARATALLRVDWLRGRFAGGRWLLAPIDGAMQPALLRAMVDAAAQGAMRMTARPARAIFRQGERPTVAVRVDGWKQRGAGGEWSGELYDAAGELLSTYALRPAADASGAEAQVVLPPGVASAEGLYVFRAAAGSLACETGFHLRYERDEPAAEPLLQAAPDGFGLLLRGKPFPVTGTTYMCGEGHRRFLLEPNPAAWERDMARMQAAGVNLLRTGIWTGWSEHAGADGTPREDVLRALEAFLATAQRHELPVIFTFFAFLPPAFGGANVYLDPVAVRAQTTFVTAIVRRCRAFPMVIWDLINEPSFCSPRHLWTCRPNGDEHERRAWSAWLQKNLEPGGDDRSREIYARWRFRDASGELWRLPDPSEFADSNIFATYGPGRAEAYRRFAQDAFAAWAQALREAIRAASHPRAMVTVGQDEGGTYERPAPQLHAASVDLTSVHTWWMNDDLLWDTVMTKAPGMPLLVEETGAMFYETLDGSPWRSEEEIAALVARKFALALADSAGFVQWLWNTNPFLPSINEAAIGFLRADGSTKPELDAFRRTARFVAAHAQRMRARETERVWMVIPHTNMFSVRNEATDATRRCVRAMAYDCGMPLRAVSEHRFAAFAAARRAKDATTLAGLLLVVPCPRELTDDCWKALLDAVRAGATVLVTGSLEPARAFEYLYGSRPPSSAAYPREIRSFPVAQEETLLVGGMALRLSYRGERMQRCLKSVLLVESAAGWKAPGVIDTARPPSLQTIPLGEGRLLWSPLPVELSDRGDATAALYAHALGAAGLEPMFTAERPPSVLVHTAVYADAVLYTLVNEGAQDCSVALTQRGAASTHRIPLPAQGTDMLFLRRDDGAMIARMNDTAQE